MLALVIDDSRAMRAFLGRLLGQLGFEVAEAENGRAGLKQLLTLEPPPTVVLVDLHMPELGGFEFVAAMRSEPAFKEVPVLMVTRETDLDMVAKALEVGANEYLMKPFTQDVLEAKLHLMGLV